jgi:hypothetical protein
MTFKDEVRSFIYGGVKEELFSELANNNKTLVLKARKSGIDSNLIIVTNKNRYYFRVIENLKNPHQFVEIEEGIINSNFKKIKSEVSFDLFEGTNSLMVVNKSTTAINVNGVEVIAKEYFSKGAPLLVNGLRILN